jgi:hypothetical protein
MMPMTETAKPATSGAVRRVSRSRNFVVQEHAT